MVFFSPNTINCVATSIEICSHFMTGFQSVPTLCVKISVLICGTLCHLNYNKYIYGLTNMRAPFYAVNVKLPLLWHGCTRCTFVTCSCSCMSPSSSVTSAKINCHIASSINLEGEHGLSEQKKNQISHIVSKVTIMFSQHDDIIRSNNYAQASMRLEQCECRQAGTGEGGQLY